MPHRPTWFRDGEVFVSFAPTVGINKDGEELYVVDASTGRRTEEINDQLSRDVSALLAGEQSGTSRWVANTGLSESFIGVPVYMDPRPRIELDLLMASQDLADFQTVTLGELIDGGQVVARAGHGSPSADMRTGSVPYIKVSDIRAGQININPTNRVSQVVAKRYWHGAHSGLKPFDLITPIRTSKNIGDFAVLMPGQEGIVLTKEVLVLRASPSAAFDNFYLLWALTLKAVRQQWERIVFMQTNREDVGGRYREIVIPLPPSRTAADACAAPMASYYLGVQALRNAYLDYLANDGRHHIFMSTTAEVADEAAEEAAVVGVAPSDVVQEP